MEKELERRRKPARTGEDTQACCVKVDVTYCTFICALKAFKRNVMQCVVCLCSTCGLAEELEQESKEKQKANLPKSACGSVSI